MKRYTHFPLSAFAVLLMLLGAPGAVRAQFTIASDDFELGSHPSGLRTVVTGGGTGIPFYTHNATGASYSPSLLTDPVFNSTVLSHTDSSTTAVGNQIVGLLPMPITLTATNDFLTLSFDVRYLNVATAMANNAGFRFGIESSNGTPITGDAQASTLDNDQGYYTQVGVGATAPPAGGNVFYNEAGGTTPILGGLDRTAVSATTNGLTINDNDIHHISFTITLLSATSLKLTMTLDGTTVQTNASTLNPRTTFDEIAFGNGFVTTPVNFAIDNVQVVSSVPEPGSLTLLLGASGAAVGLWRRRR